MPHLWIFQRARQRRGAVIVLLALLLVAIMGALAIALDGGVLMDDRRQVQSAADAAALTAATQLFVSFRHLFFRRPKGAIWERSRGVPKKLGIAARWLLCSGEIPWEEKPDGPSGSTCTEVHAAELMAPMNEVTRILSGIETGDPHAAEQLLPLIYDELRKLAAQKLAQEKPGQTLLIVEYEFAK